MRRLLFGLALLLSGCRKEALKVTPCDGIGLKVSLLIEESLENPLTEAFWDSGKLDLKRESDGPYSVWSADLPRCPEPGSLHELKISTRKGERALRVAIPRDYDPARRCLCVRYEERDVGFLEALAGTPFTKGCTLCLAGGGL